VKVLQVLPALNGGGVETGTLEVAQELVNKGHESWVLSAGGSMVERLEHAGSTHVEWDLGKKSLFTLRHIWRLRAWLQERQFDVIDVRSRMPAWVVYLAWKGLPDNTRPKLISTVHGLYSVNAYSKIMCVGERVVTVSQAARDYVISNYPDVDESKLVVIPRGIEPSDYYPEFMPSTDWSEQFDAAFPDAADKQLITMPGRLTRLKGQSDFIRLMSRLVHEHKLPVYGLIVGGEDPKRKAYAQELRDLVSELNLAEHICFTGARRDIRELFARSDLVLSLSSQPESFGRTVLEALSLGRPLVGYAHGGVAEILGALFPEGAVPLRDEETLLQAVLQQLRQPSAPAVNRQFLKQNMLDMTLQVYEGSL
jgi:glycosyltransferase involved in cell wall biosynthesis